MRLHFNLTLTYLTCDRFGSVEPGNLDWVRDATVSKSITRVLLLTQHVEDWPLSFTLCNSTGACQSRSLGPVMTMTSSPSVQGLSMSCLSSSSVPLWLDNPSWPNSRTARPSCWPTSKLHSSQICSASPLVLCACSIITAGPPLIQPRPIGSQLLATWPTFPIANC